MATQNTGHSHFASETTRMLEIPKESVSFPTNSESQQFVGRGIAKTFAVAGGEMKIFKGSITNYNTLDKFWSISYDDGDSEEMEWEELRVALKLYVDMQTGGSTPPKIHAAVGSSTPPPSTAASSTSTCVKPNKTMKKKSQKDTTSSSAKQFAAATTLMQNSAKDAEDIAKQMLSNATKNRKDLQVQVNHTKQEVADAKKVLEEAQQRLAAISETLATAKLDEETAKKKLSKATETREHIQGLADSAAVEPKRLFKEDEISTDGEEDTDNDKKKAAVVTPPKKKRRKVVKVKRLPLSDTEKAIIENEMEGKNYLEKFEEYINDESAAGELSHQNKRNIMRQVTKLVKGEGIRYDSKEYGWPEGRYFLKGTKVGATYDIQQLMKEGKECEDKWGRDHGNGWLLSHPLKKMYEFQQYLLLSSNDV